MAAHLSTVGSMERAVEVDETWLVGHINQRFDVVQHLIAQALYKGQAHTASVAAKDAAEAAAEETLLG